MRRLAILAAFLCCGCIAADLPEDARAAGDGGAGGAGAGGAGGEAGAGGALVSLPCAPRPEPSCDGASRTASFVRLSAASPELRVPLCGIELVESDELFLELWLRPAALDGTRAILVWPDGGGGVALELALREGVPVIWLQAEGGPIEYPARAPLPLDRWSHVGLSLRKLSNCPSDAPSSLDWFVHGAPTTSRCVPRGGLRALGAAFVPLGRPAPGGHATAPYEGALDELRIWDEGVTMRVAQIRMTQRFTSASGLLSSWDFDELPGEPTLLCEPTSGQHARQTVAPTREPGGPLVPLSTVEGCATPGLAARDGLALCAGALPERLDDAGSLCAAGWAPCTFDDPRVTSLTLEDALALPGCFFYDGSLFADGGCGRCDPAFDQLALGAACRFPLTTAQGSHCLSDGTLNGHDPDDGTPSCGPLPASSGLACCRGP